MTTRGMMEVATWDAAIAPLAEPVSDHARDVDLWPGLVKFTGEVWREERIGFRERWRKRVPGEAAVEHISEIIYEYTSFFLTDEFVAWSVEFQSWRESMPTELSEDDLLAMAAHAQNELTARVKTLASDRVLAADTPHFRPFGSGHKGHDRNAWRPGRYDEAWKATRAAAIMAGTGSVTIDEDVAVTGDPLNIPPIPGIDFDATELGNVYDEMTIVDYIPGTVPPVPYYTPDDWFDYSIEGTEYDLLGIAPINLTSGGLSTYLKKTEGSVAFEAYISGGQTQVSGYASATPMSLAESETYWRPFNTGSLTHKFGY